MRILHLGDLHLGRLLYNVSLLDEQKYVLDQALQIVQEQNIDLVIIAGDVFDKKHPAQKALHLYNDWLTQCLQFCPVVAIAGNHDNAAFMEYGKALFANNQYYVAGVVEPQIEKVRFMDEYGPVNVYLLPFYYPHDLKQIFPDADFEDEVAAFQFLLAKQQLDLTERNVLVMHAYVTGHEQQAPVESDSEMKSIGLKEELPFTVFADFDYVALGHLHTNQQVGRREVRYAGTPYPYSFSESKRKYFTVLDLQAKGQEILLERIPVKFQKNLRVLQGPFIELLTEAEQLAAQKQPQMDDYISVELVDNGIIRPVDKLKQYYPNLLHVQQAPVEFREESQQLITEVEQVDPLQLFKKYYESLKDETLTTEQEDLVAELLKESTGDDV